MRAPGFVERSRRRRHPPVANQQDHSIPELPALEQHEDCEYRHDHRARQRLEEGWQVSKDGPGLQDDSDRLWARHTFLARLLDLADNLLQSLLNLLHGTAPAGPAKIRDSLVDVQAVPRQLVGERYQLASERPANPTQDREREEDSHEDRRHPTQPPPLEDADQGTQEECEQDGQRHRDQHGLQPVQGRYHERDDPPALIHARLSRSRFDRRCTPCTFELPRSH